MKTLILPIAVLLLIPVVSLAAPSKIKQEAKTMQEGEWEIVVKTDMEGVPFPMPPMTHTQCITKDDKKNVANTLPSASANKEDCTVQSHKVEGNKVTWRVQCKDGSSGSGEIVQQATSYTGKMIIATANKEQSATKILKNIIGTRIGDCK